MTPEVPPPALRSARQAFDLNLLDSLAVFLDERSVGRAATRLGVSQPTASTALSRLRRHFGDPLLVRDGAGYRLTALASRLKDDLPATLRSIDRIVSAQAQFDPQTSTREFRILGSDYATARVGGPLLRLLAREAPRVRVRFENVLSAQVDNAPDSLRDVDGLFLPHGYLSHQPHLEVLVDEWVCLVSVDNSRIGPDSSSADLLALPWISTLSGREAFTPGARQMQIAGADPDVTTVTPNFFVIPDLIAGTDKIALLQRSFAEEVTASRADLRMIDPPVSLAPIAEAFWWHPDREHEPEHVWLRLMLEESTRALMRS